MNIIARCLLVVLAALAGPALACSDPFIMAGSAGVWPTPAGHATPMAACEAEAARRTSGSASFTASFATSTTCGMKQVIVSSGAESTNVMPMATKCEVHALAGEGGSGEPAPTVNVGTVTVSLPDSWTDSQSVADRFLDMSLLWGLFFGAAIVIVCIRKFANIWDRAPHGEN